MAPRFKSEEEKRSHRVTTFFNDAAMLLLHQLAEEANLSVSEWIRFTIAPHLEEKRLENFRKIEKEQEKQAKEAAKVPEYRGIKGMTGEKWNRFMKAWSEYVVFLQPQRDALIPHYGAKGVQIMEQFYHQCVAEPIVMAWEEYIDDDHKSGPIYHRNHRY